MSSLTIFVLCHNRPDFTRQTLHSILAQTDKDFELVVSDNSSNDEVERMVRTEFPQVELRRRVPMLKQLEHFNRCLDEAKTDYFCLFHDDDLMHADFVQRMRTALDSHPEAAACGCNAKIETMGRMERHASFRSLGDLERIDSPRNLARRYFSRAQCGIAPFPGYVYRRSLVGDVRFLLEGGKYSDVTWLLRLVMRAPMLWIAAPLMTYRIHGGNDGGVESPRDRLRFLGFLKQNARILGRDLLADYRCSFVYKRMLSNNNISPARRKLARAYVKHYGWLRYTNPNLYGSLIKRALVKRLGK
ncbi:MAG TPA: glycosyltransferase family 2 protein [Sideroxyarcus sp.]|nr:glycosyltransferase family 2 protein [Sideroxyarcus sp.]